MGFECQANFCWLFMGSVSCRQFSRSLVRLKDHSSEPTSFPASLQAWSGSKRERNQAQQREQGEDPLWWGPMPAAIDRSTHPFDT